MVTTPEFLEAAASRGIEILDDPAGSIRVRVGQLRDAIRLAQDLDLVVLGMDGMREDGAVLVPLIDFIADFSEIVGNWDKRVNDSSLAAVEVADAWSEEPSHVELMLDGLAD